jgi:hypothetical protein
MTKILCDLLYKLSCQKKLLALKKIYPINQDFSSSVQLNFDESYV